MTEVLLPCPFCGEQPKWRGTRSDYARGIYRLQCLGETHLIQSYGPDEGKCIAAWNRRTAGQAELVEALKFYRDGFAPKTGKLGLEWRPTESLLDDCGERARQALAPLSQSKGEG